MSIPGSVTVATSGGLPPRRETLLRRIWKAPPALPLDDPQPSLRARLLVRPRRLGNLSRFYPLERRQGSHVDWTGKLQDYAWRCLSQRLVDKYVQAHCFPHSDHGHTPIHRRLRLPSTRPCLAVSLSRPSHPACHPALRGSGPPLDQFSLEQWLGKPDFGRLWPRSLYTPMVGRLRYRTLRADVRRFPLDRRRDHPLLPGRPYGDPFGTVDAVTVDGVNSWQRFWHLELPLVMGQVKLFLVLTVIYNVQTYTLPLIMTRGGPGFATMVPGLHMFLTAVERSRYGYSSAIGALLFLLIFGLTYLNMKYVRSTVEVTGADS